MKVANDIEILVRTITGVGATIVSRTPVLHRASVTSEVIVETIVFEIKGKRAKISVWANFGSGRVTMTRQEALA